MNDELLIIIIIAVIIIFQVAVFMRTISKISLFKKIFFPINYFKARTVYIPSSEIKDIKPGEIVYNLEKYLKPEEEEEFRSGGDKFEIMLIDTTKPRGKILNSILDSLNTYLIRNKGAVSDFNLMKDIVERNCEAVDEDINTSLPVPLYMGLMGTMIGIVVGLYFVTADSLSSDSTLNSIGGLIGGVRIAMISSLAGLLCTTTGQGFLYKRAKTQVESKKHAFYTFLQTELLPVLNKNVNSTIYELQRNLTAFNETFTRNADRFEVFLESIHASFESQTEFLRLIKEMNIKQIASANVNVLKELKGSVGAIEKFNIYLGQINSFVANAGQLNESLLAQLERTSSIESLVEKIEKITIESKALMEFLNSHFSELDKHSLLVNHAIIDTDNNLKKGVESFADFTRERLDVLRRFVIDEELKLTTRLEETSGLLEELKNLSNVKESMKNMETLSKEQKSLMERQNAKLDDLAKSIDNLVYIIRAQTANSSGNRAGKTGQENTGKKQTNRYLFWSAVIFGSIIALIMLLNLTGVINI
jgi:hypothetical protein